MWLKRDRSLAIDRIAEFTAILPRNPTGCLPFFGIPVSSTIQARIGSYVLDFRQLVANSKS